MRDRIRLPSKDKKPCACGCGELIHMFDVNKYPRRFKSGHYAKTRSWKGDKNPRFNNGKCKMQNGYILIRKLDHRFRDNRGYIPEHHFIWEQRIKASLLPWSTVHHLNHIRDDNRIENLEAMMKIEHDRLESYNRKRNGLGQFI